MDRDIWQSKVSVPGDFDFDHSFTPADIDLLAEAIRDGQYHFNLDVNQDSIVDRADLTTWLSVAAEAIGSNRAYLAGDANLDGAVDAEDLNRLALNWRKKVSLWSAGDFTADGFVDSADLNALALNWRQSISQASAASAPVPEPSAWLLTFVGLALVWRRPRRG